MVCEIVSMTSATCSRFRWKVRLMLLACYNRSVCTVYVNALMTYYVFLNSLRSCMQTHVD